MLRPALAALSVVVCLSVPAYCQQSVGDAALQAARSHVPAANGRISGTVVCGDTHRPARGATVVLLSAHTGEPMMNTIARTGLDGAYTLAHVAPGEYAVLGFFPGYALPLTDDAFRALTDGGPNKSRLTELVRQIGAISVPANGDAHADVTLTRGASISGRVLYSDGSPAAQITIETQNVAAKPKVIHTEDDMIDLAAMTRTLFGHQSMSTDDLGRFRIAGLSPGTYRVAAVQSSAGSIGGNDEGEGAIFGAMLGLNLDRSAIRVYAGDTLHQSAAKTYEVRAGDEVPEISITIPLSAFHKLSGTVQALDGRLLTAAELSLTDTSDSTFNFHTKLAQDGTFTFANVPAGTYTLETTSGRIGVHQPQKGMEKSPEQFWPVVIKWAFADGSQPILVKDTNLTDAVVSLKEIPVPKDEANGPHQNNPVGVTPDDEP